MGVRRHPRFTQADVARAIKGAKRAELTIGEVRIEPDGTILIVPVQPDGIKMSRPNPWDEEWGR